MDGTRSALIIASSEYVDPGLRRLRAPASDAEALADVLRDPQIGGFEVRTLLDEPAHEVNRAVEDFFADRRPDDLLLLHVSSHGVKDEGGDLYFAAADTRLRRLGSTAVAAEFVNRRMSRSRSRRVVLLLDCCYAGAFERGMTARAGTGVGIEEQFGGRGRAVITASSAMEYAFEGDELADIGEPAPSVFTAALVEGLRTGEADRNQDGMVGLDELYDYVYDRVREVTPNQTPGKWTFGVQGDLYIARRSRPVRTPAPLPPELQEAVDHPLASVRVAAVQELERLLAGTHDGVVLGARLTLERLADDDSRRVAAAATAVLATVTLADQPPPPPLAPPAAVPGQVAPPAAVPEPPAADPEPPAAVPEPAAPLPEPVAPAAMVAGGPSASAPATPRVAPAPQRASSAPVASHDPATAAAAPAVPAAIPLPASPDAPEGDDARRAAGLFALLGAALLIGSLFPGYQWDEPLGVISRVAAVNVVIIACLAFAAGAATLLPRSARLIGPGLLLSVAAASTRGLLDLAMEWAMDDGFGSGFGLALAAYAILGVAAGLAALAMVRTDGVRLTRWPPQDRLGWSVVLLGVAGAVALTLQAQALRDDGAGWYVLPAFLSVVLAVVLPIGAAVAVPRRLGASVLVGWIVIGAAMSMAYASALEKDRGLGNSLIDVFALTLVALLVPAVLLARAATTPGAGAQPCGDCGEPLPAGVPYCPECGAPAPQQDAAGEP